jgi:putative membrane protein
LFDVKIPLNPAPFTLIGVALAIFLGFRNTAGYERFWEGRKLWGSLLNDSRTLARQSLTLTTLSKESKEVKEFQNLIIAICYCLKHQLRETDASEDLVRILGTEWSNKLKEYKFKPAYLLLPLSEWTQRQVLAGHLDTMTRTSFDLTLARISDWIGGCERIASTPIPYPYTVLLHRTVYLYCLSLPFGLVDNIGWATPLFAVFISYTFMALDEVVTQIEDPFGMQDHDLPLDHLTKFIEVAVRELADDVYSGEFSSPDDYLLT